MQKCYFLLLFFIGSLAFGQSNPTAFNLSTGNYSLTDWASTSASGTYPANMIFHFTNDPSGITYSATLDGTADYTCAYNLIGVSRINGQGANGFSFISTSSALYDNCISGTASTTRFVGAAVLALNSTGKTTINVGWTGRTITAGDGATPRTFSIKLQYRLGTTGIWTDVASSSYTSAAPGNSATTNVTLPIVCENRSDLFLRWVYYQLTVAGSTGTRPELGIDEITVGSGVVSNTLALTFSSSTTSALSLPFITGTINDAVDPAAVTGFVLDVKDNGVAIPAANYTLSVSSSNASVVPVANVGITQNNGNALIKVNPAGVGYADLTFTLTKGSYTKTLVTNYAASQSADANAKWPTSFADASGAIAIDDNYMVVCNDELNSLYVFNRNTSGLPIVTYDFNQNNILALTDGTPYKEVDVEAGVKSIANIGRQYWMGSQSNSSNFKDKPNRNRVFAVTVTGTGSSTSFADAGHYNNLKQDLLAWGDANGYAFTASAAAGMDCKAINGYNIEGMVFGPDNTTMYIGFRAPLVPTANRTKAVIAPILDFEVWFNNGNPLKAANLGKPIELDLGGRGIRDIIRLSTGFYMILAGNYSGTPVTGMVYKWSGNGTEAPIALPGFNINDLTAEGAMEIFENGAGSLTKLQIIMDNGSKVYYGDAVEAKAITHDGYKKFQSEIFESSIAGGVLALQFQYINTALQGNTTVLSWGFEGAASVSKFVVEKSINGSTFTSLATLVASASSNYSYSFLADKNQRNFYRIKAISASGAIIYSSIKSVAACNEGGVNSYPNPINVDGSFCISDIKETAWQGALFNEAGKLVKRFNLVNAHSKVDVKGLIAGSYILKLIGDGEVLTGKVIVR